MNYFNNLLLILSVTALGIGTDSMGVTALGSGTGSHGTDSTSVTALSNGTDSSGGGSGSKFRAQLRQSNQHQKAKHELASRGLLGNSSLPSDSTVYTTTRTVQKKENTISIVADLEYWAKVAANQVERLEAENFSIHGLRNGTTEIVRAVEFRRAARQFYAYSTMVRSRREIAIHFVDANPSDDFLYLDLSEKPALLNIASDKYPEEFANRTREDHVGVLVHEILRFMRFNDSGYAISSEIVATYQELQNIPLIRRARYMYEKAKTHAINAKDKYEKKYFGQGSSSERQVNIFWLFSSLPQ